MQNIQEMEKKLEPSAPPHFPDAWVLPDQLIISFLFWLDSNLSKEG